MAKNIFGEDIPYKTPVLTAEQITTITPIINAIADQIEAQFESAEMLKYYHKPIDVILYFITPKVREYIDFPVDGNSIKSIVVSVINERVANITASLEEV